MCNVSEAPQHRWQLATCPWIWVLCSVRWMGSISSSAALSETSSAFSEALLLRAPYLGDQRKQSYSKRLTVARPCAAEVGPGSARAAWLGCTMACARKKCRCNGACMGAVLCTGGEGVYEAQGLFAGVGRQPKRG